jgi:hypothetical protein
MSAPSSDEFSDDISEFTNLTSEFCSSMKTCNKDCFGVFGQMPMRYPEDPLQTLASIKDAILKISPQPQGILRAK